MTIDPSQEDVDAAQRVLGEFVSTNVYHGIIIAQSIALARREGVEAERGRAAGICDDYSENYNAAWKRQTENDKANTLSDAADMATTCAEAIRKATP